MSWQNVKIRADRPAALHLVELLMDHGALSVSLEDARAGTPVERPVFAEPGEPRGELWDVCTVGALFPLDADVPAALAAAAAAAGLAAPPPFSIERLEEQDWVARTQELLAPLHVSRRVWIVHTWHTPPDPAAVNVLIDPGTAFGTGGHATTRLCLEWLDERVGGGEIVLDWGTGSGILAIAALRLGAARAVGVDLDPEAIRVARANAALNHAAVELFAPGGAPDVRADLVLANILANPLKTLAPTLTRATRPGGAIALSGLLANQVDEVAAFYRDAFSLDAPRVEDGWALLAGHRR